MITFERLATWGRGGPPLFRITVRRAPAGTWALPDGEARHFYAVGRVRAKECLLALYRDEDEDDDLADSLARLGDSVPIRRR